jgi:RNA polymerase sigma factor (sigma-70 family)
MDEVSYTDEHLYSQDQRAWGEMMSDIFHRAINSLNKTEKKIIRHMHEIRMESYGHKTFKKMSRKELAEDLKITPMEVLRIRTIAIKKIKDFIEDPKI